MKRKPFRNSSLYRIQLTTNAKDCLADLSDASGITQVTLASRIVEWFASKPLDVQTAILGLYPKSIEQEVATLLLKLKNNRTTEDNIRHRNS